MDHSTISKSMASKRDENTRTPRRPNITSKKRTAVNKRNLLSCFNCFRTLPTPFKRFAVLQPKRAMDLSKMANDKKLDLCRFYFRGGFALAPFLWAVNAIWFFNEAFRKSEYEQQPQIRRYVIYSGIGAILWTIAIVAWIVVFQTNRVAWGQFADDISFIIPVGE